MSKTLGNILESLASSFRPRMAWKDHLSLREVHVSEYVADYWLLEGREDSKKQTLCILDSWCVLLSHQATEPIAIGSVKYSWKTADVDGYRTKNRTEKNLWSIEHHSPLSSRFCVVISKDSDVCLWISTWFGYLLHFGPRPVLPASESSYPGKYHT